MSRLTTDLTEDRAWIVGLLEPVILIMLVTAISVLIAALL